MKFAAVVGAYFDRRFTTASAPPFRLRPSFAVTFVAGFDPRAARSRSTTQALRLLPETLAAGLTCR